MKIFSGDPNMGLRILAFLLALLLWLFVTVIDAGRFSILTAMTKVP